MAQIVVAPLLDAEALQGSLELAIHGRRVQRPPAGRSEDELPIIAPLPGGETLLALSGRRT